jgi:hypothetical protein
MCAPSDHSPPGHLARNRAQVSPQVEGQINPAINPQAGAAPTA